MNLSLGRVGIHVNVNVSLSLKKVSLRWQISIHNLKDGRDSGSEVGDPPNPTP